MADTVTGNYFIPTERSYETMQKIAALNVKAISKLAGLQFELATLGIETGVAQAKLLSQPGGYEKFYSSESKLASVYGSRVFEISRETTDLLLKSGDELNGILSTVFSVAKQKMAIKKSAAPVVKPEVKPAPKKPAKKKSAKKSG